MPTSQWVKKLGGHAGELYVAAELSKRGIPNSLLPENFSDDDIMFGGKNGEEYGFIQVKSCHPDRSETFRLEAKHEKKWRDASENEFVALVWLGKTKTNDPPIYWIAPKTEVAKKCVEARPSNPETITERRLAPDKESGLAPSWKHARLEKAWRNNWGAFEKYRPNPSTVDDFSQEEETDIS